MTRRLVRWWAWIGEHRVLAGWVIGVVGVVAFGGGVALGAAREAPEPLQSVAVPPAVVRPRAVSIEAVVLARRPNGFIARAANGDLVLVRTTEATRYRLKGGASDATAVRDGARVLVVGRPTNRVGVVRAHVVAVRGMAAPPVSPGAVDPPR